MPQGKCKLCWEDRELQESHLLPAAVYKMCRSETAGVPDPIGIRNDLKTKSLRVFQSSRQITGYVLCFSCEQLLNAKGEAWVLPQLSTLFQGFPLYEKLTAIEPTIVDTEVSAYEGVKVPDIRIDSLVHFGMGIFWKAAVHEWHIGYESFRLEFGPYRDQIRSFLLGGIFPKNASLVVNVVPPTLPTVSTVLPHRRSGVQVPFYSFYVPGIEFMLILSRTMPDYFRNYSVASNPLQPIMVGAFSAEFIGVQFAKALEEGHIPAKVAGRLQRGRGKKI